ncbi:MAG: hypothetical protein F4Y98_02860 [Chloroflexi bacterium]|nr:hypothetical protein [Chloroflexota bacterium]
MGSWRASGRRLCRPGRIGAWAAAARPTTRRRHAAVRRTRYAHPRGGARRRGPRRPRRPRSARARRSDEGRGRPAAGCLRATRRRPRRGRSTATAPRRTRASA